ncbi:Hypoxia induced protein conserved region [Lutimaribacter pacificus]|uniref:Hypoxia induced protein conserved region n=1 Tax=Lutimaribacter pacificus TaxID=391948 RepID=A0A1H0H5C1_9RHOB|nr:twin transmembrane helix small protein [Lutimaribacter pacificus]SDO14436.1 Hypoxia induced protein conserved region [Lutimaribacter pacificus]SHJ96581.1 Hypoxia induced protein conserved region [Lutimaribacter pacificus]
MADDPLFFVVAAACLAVVGILILGISHFGKGTMEAAKKSNQMMKLRIAAQFFAVVLILLFVWLRGGGN